MTTILGISAFYHDSAAALIIDGEIKSAVQEERFTRKKHDSSYPFNSVKYVLESSKLKLIDVDYIVFFEKPLSKFKNTIKAFLTIKSFMISFIPKTIDIFFCLFNELILSVIPPSNSRESLKYAWTR